MQSKAFLHKGHPAPRQQLILRLGRLRLFLLLLLLAGTPVRAFAAAVTTYTGNINGAAHLIEVPADWNGTLLLYSHGYVPPSLPNPATDVGNPATGAYLLAHVYALAGSSYQYHRLEFHPGPFLRPFDSGARIPPQSIPGVPATIYFSDPPAADRVNSKWQEVLDSHRFYNEGGQHEPHSQHRDPVRSARDGGMWRACGDHCADVRDGRSADQRVRCWV
jgi:hypothetical protein